MCCVMTLAISEIDALETDIISTKIDSSYWQKKINKQILAQCTLPISDVGNEKHTETWL